MVIFLSQILNLECLIFYWKILQVIFLDEKEVDEINFFLLGIEDLNWRKLWESILDKEKEI